MRKVSQTKLREIVATRLNLIAPDVRLKSDGDRINGYVISESFKGIRDHQRQGMIWDALETMLDPDEIKGIGMLLAYTPGEWNLESDNGVSTNSRKRLVGK